MAIAFDSAAFPSGRTRKASEVVARSLANYIIDNDLAEGTRLPTEREMLEVIDVGRTTLREALRLLETSGVITIRSGRKGGPVVRRPQAGDLSESLTLLLQFEKASLADVVRAREAMEPTTTRLAAERITDEQVDRLKESVELMRAKPNDHAVFDHENQAFHSTIAEASGNVVLRIFNDTLKAIADGRIAGVEYSPKRRAAVADDHLAIAEALERRDADAAEDLMRAHLAEAARFWQTRYATAYETAVRWVH